MFLTLMALALQQDAEATFRKFEKTYVDAKSLSATFTLEMREVGQKNVQASLKGFVRVKPGNRLVLKLTAAERGRQKDRVIRSDGKTIVELDDGARSEHPTPEGTSKFYASMLARLGYGLLWHHAPPHDAKLPDPDAFAKASDFKLSKDDEGQVLEYTLTLKDAPPMRMKLWFTDDLLPKKRVLADEHVEVTETYEDVRTTEIIDADFDHVK